MCETTTVGREVCLLLFIFGRFLDHGMPLFQDDAKKAVAVAFRNRWRRHRVRPESLRDEIQPKNILMIGPTGWCVHARR